MSQKSAACTRKHVVILFFTSLRSWNFWLVRCYFKCKNKWKWEHARHESAPSQRWFPFLSHPFCIFNFWITLLHSDLRGKRLTQVLKYQRITYPSIHFYCFKELYNLCWSTVFYSLQTLKRKNKSHLSLFCKSHYEELEDEADARLVRFFHTTEMYLKSKNLVFKVLLVQDCGLTHSKTPAVCLPKNTTSFLEHHPRYIGCKSERDLC
jgi:hypothetical protein